MNVGCAPLWFQQWYFFFLSPKTSVLEVVVSFRPRTCEVAFKFAAIFIALHTCIADSNWNRSSEFFFFSLLCSFAAICRVYRVLICQSLFLLSDCCEVWGVAHLARHCVCGLIVCKYFSPLPRVNWISVCLPDALFLLFPSFFYCVWLNESFPLLGTWGHAIHECE